MSEKSVNEAERIYERAKMCATECVERLSKEDCNPVALTAMTIGLLMGTVSTVTGDMKGTKSITTWMTIAFGIAETVLSGKGLKVRLSFEMEEPSPSS